MTSLTYPARVTFFRDLRTLLRYGGFRRLFSVRLLSQFSDGVFQVALVSSVLFSPERAPNAGAIAAGFATILLPFSVLGPFVGVFLDRWSRRLILMVSNLVRAVVLVLVAVLVAHDNVGLPFFVLVLAAFSVNRFLLAGLSASLPHVVDRDLLVTANSVVPTCGSIAYLSGLGAGGALHALTDSDPVVIATASVLYLLSSGVAYLLPFLGPDLEQVGADVRAALGNVVKGLADAARHLPRLGRLALTIVAAARLPYGLMIVGLVLISRNNVQPGSPAGGLAGAGIAVAASGLGFGAAAVITPTMTHRFGLRRYITALALLGYGHAGLPGLAVHPLGDRGLGLRSRPHDAGHQDLRRHHPAANRRRRLPRSRLLDLRRAPQRGAGHRDGHRRAGAAARRPVHRGARRRVALVPRHRGRRRPVLAASGGPPRDRAGSLGFPP